MKKESTGARSKGMWRVSCAYITRSASYLLFLAALSFMFAGVSFAGTYYVSPTAVNITYSTCTSAAYPCTAAAAMANAVAGDIVVFLNGEYNLGALNTLDYRQNILQPANSGTSGNPITFQSQTPLGAVLIGTGVGTPSVVNDIGTEDTSYIVINGFKITSVNSSTEAEIYIYDGNNVTVENCEVVGASVSNAGGNVAGIKVEAMSSSTIRNNYIHGVQDPAGDHNTAGLWTAFVQDLLVTQNTFANNTENIFSKYTSANDTFTLNLLEQLTSPGLSNSNASFFIQNFGGTVTNMTIAQNIIIGGVQGILFNPAEGPSPNSISVYNNTIYGFSQVGYVISTAETGASTWSAWDNIIAAPSGSYYLDWEYANEAPASLDYNDYYIISGAPEWGGQIYAANYITSSLLLWQTYSGFDTHSVTTNPNFVNGSGIFILATDFQRRSYPTNGLGGAYAPVMGAYITGNETIGYSGPKVSPMPPLLLEVQ